ncbi:putative siderophore-binding lipoprotein YfiY [wastewater metagenome]|uniref:Putative siderophore-binding lipoprotein YfiY n=2 Tax=unclassified sequences TaxID=12908 RepID=A0A5B8RHW0_9ZZZZ|nr:ABC transporter substrate-binding protein [Arhodomonas sp. KWT]QEA06317.1 putative siderophore-binding lipoprotein YfiY [uncultured organism]
MQQTAAAERIHGILAMTLVFMVALAATPVADARTVVTAYGEVDIDGTPQRVVTLYEGALDAALAVDVAPVGAVTTRGGDGVAGYIQDRAGDVAIVGTPRETNVEAVLAQRPDLILASPRLPRAQYELLSGIAPTVVPDVQGFRADAWKDEARLYARALGQTPAMDEAIARVENRAARIASAVTGRYNADDRTAYLVRWMPQGPMVMSSRLFATGLLGAAGFDVETAGLVGGDRPHSDPLSLEALSRIDGDWLFLATLNADGREALDAARTSPAFRRLDVVRRERVVPVDGQLWTSASGPLAAEVVLDDIEAAVLQ